jgi:hypothetical protein
MNIDEGGGFEMGSEKKRMMERKRMVMMLHPISAIFSPFRVIFIWENIKLPKEHSEIAEKNN